MRLHSSRRQNHINQKSGLDQDHTHIHERNPNHSPNSFWYRNRNHPSRGLYYNEYENIKEENV